MKTSNHSSDRPPRVKGRAAVMDRPPTYVTMPDAKAPRRPPPSNGRARQRPPTRPVQPSGPAGYHEAPPAPTLLPPISVSAAAGETFHEGQKITGLFTAGEPRNAWIAVPGLGWKKLSTSSDGTIAALAILAAHARQTSATVDLREDSSGAITELYVW